MAKRKTTKLITRESTLSGAVNDAMSELQALREEMGEWKDNLEEKLSNTPKYEQVSEAFDTLDQYADNEPDAPDSPPEGMVDKVVWAESHPYGRRSPSRSTRLSHAVIALRAVVEHIDDFLADHKDEEDEVFASADRDEWEQYARDVEEIVDNVEGVEFPGMY